MINNFLCDDYKVENFLLTHEQCSKNCFIINLLDLKIKKRRNSYATRRKTFLNWLSLFCSPSLLSLTTALCARFRLLKRHKFHFGFGILIFKINIDNEQTRMAELKIYNKYNGKMLKEKLYLTMLFSQVSLSHIFANLILHDFTLKLFPYFKIFHKL
jgi:hypothetical protein